MSELTHRPYDTRESPVGAAKRVDAYATAAGAIAVAQALQPEETTTGTAVALADHPGMPEPREVRITLHTSKFIYFEREVETFGLVRVETVADGLEFWVGTVCAWKSY